MFMMKALNFAVFPMLALLSGAAAVAVVMPKHGRDHIHHRDVTNRTDGHIHSKRFSNSRWTFYDVGLGACGKTNVPSDFIVALNSAQFGGGYPGPHCFQKITMTYNGKTTTAQITDECPGCPYGGLDLSRGLFDFFASEDLGVIQGSWSFGGGGDGGNSGGGGGHDDPPQHTTTTKPHTSSEEHSTKTPTTTSEHTSTSSKQQPTTTTSKAPTSTSTSVEPSTTSTVADNPANLNQFVSVFEALGGLVVAGSQF